MEGLKKIVENYYEDAVKIRRYLHENPELSNQELNTTQLIKKELEKYGIEIEKLDIKTGISGILKGKHPGKTIAIREDIDALPMNEINDLPFASKVEGVAHSCGHDIHTSVLLLCARVLSHYKDLLKGNVRFIFQPAEEIMDGALSMINAGLMKLEPKTDIVIGVHTSPDVEAGKIGIIGGPANASSDMFKIKVVGVGGHGAHPYRCVDPIVMSAYLVTQLQTIISRENQSVYPAVLTVGMIHGGTAPNIIPQEVTLEGTIRSFSEKERRKILKSVPRISKGCCEGMRGKAEVEIIEGIPPLINDMKVVSDIKNAASKIIGEENIVEFEVPSPGSDDFSLFLEYCPGVQFRIGTSNDDPASKYGLHNPHSIFDEKSIEIGALVMVQYILDKLNQESE